MSQVLYFKDSVRLDEPLSKDSKKESEHYNGKFIQHD